LNHRLLALALGTFAIGTGSFVFAGLLGALALDIGSLGSLGWAGALCTLLSLAVLAVGTCAKGPEAAPER
jgi:predicted MFS family arabinose efflux permease